MIENTSKTIRAIRGCLEYLLMDVSEIGSDRTASLIRLAIAELDRMNERDLDASRPASRPSSLT